MVHNFRFVAPNDVGSAAIVEHSSVDAFYLAVGYTAEKKAKCIANARKFTREVDRAGVWFDHRHLMVELQRPPVRPKRDIMDILFPNAQ